MSASACWLRLWSSYRNKNRPEKWKDMSGKRGEHVKGELSGEWGRRWLRSGLTGAWDFCSGWLKWNKSHQKLMWSQLQQLTSRPLLGLPDTLSDAPYLARRPQQCLWSPFLCTLFYKKHWSIKSLMFCSSMFYCSVYMQSRLLLSDKVISHTILSFKNILFMAKYPHPHNWNNTLLLHLWSSYWECPVKVNAIC